VSADGRWIISGGDDRLVIIWERSGAKVEMYHVFVDFSGPIAALAFTPDMRLVIGDNRKVFLCELNDPELALVELGATLTGAVTALGASATKDKKDRLQLAVGTAGGDLQVWDIHADTPQLVHQAAVKVSVNALAISPKDQSLAAGLGDGTLAMLKGKAGIKMVPVKSRAVSVISSVAWDPDGKTVVTTHADTTLRSWTWEGKKVEEEQPLRAPFGHVLGVAFSPDGRVLSLAGGPHDQAVSQYDVAGTPRMLRELTRSMPAIHAISYAPDGRTFAAAGGAGQVLTWDVPRAAWGEPTSLRDTDTALYALAFSPDSRVLATAGDKSKVVLWNVAGSTTKPAHVLTGASGALKALDISPSGRYLAAGGLGNAIHVWDLHATPPKEVRKIAGPAARALRFFPDESKLLSAAGTVIQAWDLRDGKLAASSFNVHTAAVTAMAFAPDGGKLASADLSGRLVVWDMHSDKKIGDWDLGVPLYSLAFAADARHVAAGTARGTALVFRVGTAP
jgi:WD40 repeat protein